MLFNDIIGHDRQKSILKRYIKEDRFCGSYLFCGPEGIGKHCIAQAYALALNDIESLTHPDVRVIDSDESGIKIESIRQLQSEFSLRPYEAKAKVFIIDNAHRISAEAQSSLLKILEEPPKFGLIILITDKPALLFKTIISRCRVLKFFPIVRQELKNILEQKYGLDSINARSLAYFSEGRLGYALKLKDAGILEEKNRIIDSGGNIVSVDRPGLRRGLNILGIWLRDIYLTKAGAPWQEIINFDRKEELVSRAAQVSYQGLDRALEVISGSLLHLEQNVNTKLLQSNLKVNLWKT